MSEVSYCLKDKLLKNEIEFPETTKFEYEDLYTYRAVERNWERNPRDQEAWVGILRRIHTIMVFPVSWIEE